MKPSYQLWSRTSNRTRTSTRLKSTHTNGKCLCFVRRSRTWIKNLHKGNRRWWQVIGKLTGWAISAKMLNCCWGKCKLNLGSRLLRSSNAWDNYKTNSTSKIVSPANCLTLEKPFNQNILNSRSISDNCWSSQNMFKKYKSKIRTWNNSSVNMRLSITKRWETMITKNKLYKVWNINWQLWEGSWQLWEGNWRKTVEKMPKNSPRLTSSSQPSTNSSSNCLTYSQESTTYANKAKT